MRRLKRESSKAAHILPVPAVDDLEYSSAMHTSVLVIGVESASMVVVSVAV